MREILCIAASDNPTVRTTALTYFLDNAYSNSSYREYDPRNFSDLAFVPAVLGSEKMLAKPFKVSGLPQHYSLSSNVPWQVCTDPKWTALGFAVVDPMLPDRAAFKLKLNHRPHELDLMTLLEKSPPEYETTARQWFDILYDCVLGRLFYLL